MFIKRRKIQLLIKNNQFNKPQIINIKIYEITSYFKQCWEATQKRILNINIDSQIYYAETTVMQDQLDSIATDE